MMVDCTSFHGVWIVTVYSGVFDGSHFNIASD